MQTQVDSYIETFSGKKFYFLDPRKEDVDIIDIAHSLSMQCRFTGHSNSFYSIAEHSLIVSSLCPKEHKLWGLLHDASEAYLTDVASPVKPHLTNYKLMEKVIMEPICNKFGISNHMPDEVHKADMEALRIEAYWLMNSRGQDWLINQGVSPYNSITDNKLYGYNPTEAKKAFLNEFARVTDGKV
jgi:5'-nucleotidase